MTQELTPVEVDMLAKVAIHYRHAKEKHPYFCDKVTNAYWNLEDVQDNLARIRRNIKQDIKLHDIQALSLLVCEFMEFEEAWTRSDNSAAVGECYDAIAVLLRIIDVIEGRQKLGKVGAE